VSSVLSAYLFNIFFACATDCVDWPICLFKCLVGWLSILFSNTYLLNLSKNGLVAGMSNTAKHIMNNFVSFTIASNLLEELKLTDQADYWTIQILCKVQGAPTALFSVYGSSGNCRMTGRPLMLSDTTDADLLTIIGNLAGQAVRASQAFRFKRAHVESCVYVRPKKDGIERRRNESIVMDDDRAVIQVTDLIGLVNDRGTEILGTFVCGTLMEEPQNYGVIPRLGSRSVLVPHMFCLHDTFVLVVRKTEQITRQMVILLSDPVTGNILVSPPSNRFRPT